MGATVPAVRRHCNDDEQQWICEDGIEGHFGDGSQVTLWLAGQSGLLFRSPSQCNAFSVANYFLAKADEDRTEMTMLALIKLVYVAHGWRLGVTGQPLISDRIEAWQYGPAIPSLYLVYKVFGRRAIPVRSRLLLGRQIAVHPLLDRVWQEYRHLDGLHLSALTHQADTPWAKVWREHGGSPFSGAVIPDSLIREYYADLRKAKPRHRCNDSDVAQDS